MRRVREETLTAVSEELACHPWREAEIADLVAPKYGVITGFQDLLDHLEELRALDLGLIPPAQGIQPPEGKRD